MNLRRAHWARLALEAFADETGAELTEQALGDLIADLGHLCDAEGLDFLALTARGLGTWRIEQIEPDGIASPPQVFITIQHER